MRLVALAGFAFLACAGPRPAVPEARNPEQARYLAEVGTFPLEFSVRRSDFGTAVDRAYEWLETYHSLKIMEADQEFFKKVLLASGAGHPVSCARSRGSGRVVHTRCWNAGRSRVRPPLCRVQLDGSSCGSWFRRFFGRHDRIRSLDSTIADERPV